MEGIEEHKASVNEVMRRKSVKKEKKVLRKHRISLS